MSSDYAFVMNNKKFNADLNYNSLMKVGKTIGHQLINDKIYIVKSKVTEENFLSFINILNDDNMEPEIDEDNYYDYFILSMEFNNKLLHDHLSKSEYNDIKNISFLKKAISKENTDTFYCEEYISEHLDFFLGCYKEEMSKILPTTLYNIFHHQNRVLYNQECAYQFIKYVLSKSENDTNKSNICILLGTLDGEKISSESLQECLSKSDERYGFTPKIRS